MTTNVFDRAGALIATDSRWSCEISGYASIYIDDAHFEKIVVDRHLAFMFAGDSRKIDVWKQWIKRPDRDYKNRPEIEGRHLALCMIDINKGSAVLQRNQDVPHGDYSFAGTGTLAAFQCWLRNKDAIKAVETAKLADRLSGGTVKFFRFKTREHNLLSPDEFASLRDGITSKGKVMYFQNPMHIPVAEAAAADPKIAEALSQIASGAVNLTAPSAAAENEWTEEDIRALDEVLRVYYPVK